MPSTARMLRIGRNAAARLGAQVWAKLLAFLLAPMITRYAGATALGRYILILTVVGIAIAFTDLGLALYLTREVAREPDIRRQGRLAGEVLVLKVVISALTWVVLAVGAPLLPLPPATRRLRTRSPPPAGRT